MDMQIAIDKVDESDVIIEIEVNNRIDDNYRSNRKIDILSKYRNVDKIDMSDKIGKIGKKIS